MKKMNISSMLLVALMATGTQAFARDVYADNYGSTKPFSMAVMGDWPYNKLLLDNAYLLRNSINSDPSKITRVLHLGDIHSGSMPCTSAGILPPIATSDPGWNQAVFAEFQYFLQPLVYTPGDNEWSDCQKTKEKSSGAPLNELASVRQLFFTQPNRTLGGLGGVYAQPVKTQGGLFDPNFPQDAQYVENKMWETNRIVFVTVNMPGSNNDTLPWAAPFVNVAAQADEVAKRTAADIRWLHSAFVLATKLRAKGVVIGLQADMWDPAALVAGGDGLSAYKPFVQALADESVAFGKPVLLFNGDSHVYGKDQPLADPSSPTGKVFNTQAVTNLMRVTVQGSTTAPAEWVRLTVNPRSKDLFTVENVPYCKDPLTTCNF